MALASPGTPAETRAYIVERLTGETGEPDRILAPARSLAERTLPVLAKGLASQFPSAVPIELDTVDLTRFADAAGAGGACAMTIATSPNSPDALLILADSTVAALLVSVLFGGDPEEPASPLDRPPSPTEVEVMAIAIEEVARAINGSGERGFCLDLPLPRPIVGAELDKARMRDGPAVRISYVLGVGPTRGRITVMMPQRVLLQHRGDATAVHADMRDGEWRERFGEGVMRSSVALEATMPVAKMTLAAVAQLKEGQVIAITGSARSEVRLSARNRTLFVGELGKLGQNYTVRIRTPFDERQDLIDGLMTA